MALTAKNLAEGQLPSAKGTLFTAAGPTVVKLISGVNTSASLTETVIFYYKKGTSRQLKHAILAPNRACEAITNGRVLEMDNGDLIEGQATDAATVDYVISGAA